MKIRARVRLLSVEVIEVEVGELATEADIAGALVTTAEEHAECLGLQLLDAQWIGDPLFELGRSTVPENGWVEVHGHRWATDGQLMVHDAPPLPRRICYPWWTDTHKNFRREKLARFVVPRTETAEECLVGLHLAVGNDPDSQTAADVGVRADRLRELGEVRYARPHGAYPCAFIYPPGDDLPIAVIALCLDRRPTEGA